MASESLLLTKHQLKGAVPLSLILTTSVWFLVLVLKKGGAAEALRSITGLGTKTSAVSKPEEKQTRKPGGTFTSWTSILAISMSY